MDRTPARFAKRSASERRSCAPEPGTSTHLVNLDWNIRSPDAGPIGGASVRATYMDGDEVPVDVPMLTGRSYSSPDGG